MQLTVKQTKERNICINGTKAREMILQVVFFLRTSVDLVAYLKCNAAGDWAMGTLALDLNVYECVLEKEKWKWIFSP